jgi:probable HAF family extracellular repeat protein
MKSRIFTWITAMTLFAALALPFRLAAQHSKYKLIEIGTFGGPASYFTDPGTGPGSLVLNNQGMLAGKADTSTPCGPDCFFPHVFRWDNDGLADLGTLPGGNASDVAGINARGWIAGNSTNGEIDALTGGAVVHAVLWKNDEITDLGTLGEGTLSTATYVNDAGQVIGASTINTTPDPFSFAGAAIHPFIWQNGVMRDLGTLGGPDAFPNNGCADPRHGLVTGGSFINSTPNPDTGVPTMHAVLWQDGKMTDIPTLGGDLAGDTALCANNRGQVAGSSGLPGGLCCHPFLWDHGVLTDLGTLGGDFGLMHWLNDAGEVVGIAAAPGDASFHATLWRNGVITDLGTLAGDCFSDTSAINSHNQIVGSSFNCDTNTERAVLWDRGSILDLNTLIPAKSRLRLSGASNINDRGEIAGRGLPAGCDDTQLCGHDFLLIPCDNATTCEDNADVASAATPATQNNAAVSTQRSSISTHGSLTPPQRLAAWRSRLARRYHFPGLRGPRD